MVSRRQEDLRRLWVVGHPRRHLETLLPSNHMMKRTTARRKTSLATDLFRYIEYLRPLLFRQYEIRVKRILLGVLRA
jgi:hypothetical protein